VDVWLDLTHGINYLPSVSLVAAVDAVETLKLLGLDASLRLVNSDPYPPGERHNCSENPARLPLLAENVMEVDVPVRVPEPVTEMYEYRVYSILSKEVVRELSVWDKDVYHTASNANRLVALSLKAVRHVLPLVLANLAPRLTEGLGGRSPPQSLPDRRLVRDLAASLLRDLKRALQRTVRITDDGHLDTRSVVREDRIVQAIPYVKALALTANVLERAKALGCMSGEGVKLACIQRIVEEVIGSYNPVARVFASREVVDLVDSIASALARGESLADWRLWKTLKGTGQERLRHVEEEELKHFLNCIEVRYVTDTDKVLGALQDRNFLAHAGLRYDLVEVRYTCKPHATA
jgi:CRISPR-associated protein Csx1